MKQTSGTELDTLLRRAIAEKRRVRFVLDGRRRIAEPHDYGVIKGEPRLFFYQTGGESSSGRPFGWRWAVLSRISGLELLEERFAGPRPAPTGRHVQWDALIATVSPRAVSAELSTREPEKSRARPGKPAARKDRRRP